MALDRVEGEHEDWFAYNVFTCSHADLRRIQSELQRIYRDSRAVIAKSEPTEVAALMLMQLVRWSPHEAGEKRKGPTS